MTHVIRKQQRGPNHPKNNRSKLRKLLSQLPSRQSQPTQVYRCFKGDVLKRPKLVATYHHTKPLPRNDSRRNHQLLRRLQGRKFVDGTGYLTPTLRQLLANQGLHQMTRLQRKWQEIEERSGQRPLLPEAERQQFKQDFSLWYKQGCPETRENYFWRIKYCGLIELGLEGHYWAPIRRQHEQRHKRGLKNALYRD
jgi:hypothetical protein